ncbi:MAG: hypothetical protein JNK12_05195 [Acidimicrobiales bacterium]|nr:hypothetical protein [Acidimicrobiales bacterium]
MSAQTKQRGPGGRRIEMMRRRLDLTDEQAETLRERLGEHRRQAVEIIRDVLDDEQRARFDAHLERRRNRGRGRGRGPGRGHGHHGHGHGQHGEGGTAAEATSPDVPDAPEADVTPTDSD